jgi:hypothetical protein
LQGGELQRAGRTVHVGHRRGEAFAQENRPRLEFPIPVNTPAGVPSPLVSISPSTPLPE